ncbi:MULTISPECIES: hypothetical protein [Paenibacillus]|uniref:Uncharacterized protein n=1 Tax=Paenibacillus radicis (ex Xue et al. 2023) TaxID=2972489 RepID=A0ABT1Y9E9_9BACL|nr:hypothetical protein [Paenibacillus radicis (ex Xue et al. 2023)]MCR8629811.1 hypothetical protein [Paenibacillus radicis (ex Xue et al. 2023)]
MSKQQQRWNLKLKKSNSYLGTVYLGEPLPLIEDVIMIGDKKYSIIEIIPGTTHDSSDVFVEEAKKK